MSSGPLPPAKPFPGPRKGVNGTAPSNLSGEATAILRDQLLAELEGLGLKGRPGELDTPDLAKDKNADARR
jgi:hypothetical protein